MSGLRILSIATAVAALSAAPAATAGTALPVGAMESALQAKGTLSQNVLTVGIERSDIKGVKIGRTPIKPSFEINGDLAFQQLSRGRVLLNGDVPLRRRELDPFIGALIAHGIHFQAEHQHMYDFSPMVWFVHFRAVGAPVALASALHAVLEQTTSTPFPQTSPAHPHTALPVSRLKSILHAYSDEVGSDGVVTFSVARRGVVKLGGVPAKTQTNVATTIAVEPLDASGTRAAMIPDFGMVGGEINHVVGTMRAMGWDIGCLYNQETDERPQLYFSHEFKVGDPVELAREVRAGLNHMNTH